MSDRQTANDLAKWIGPQRQPKTASAKQRGKPIDKSIGNAGGSGLGDQAYTGDDAPTGSEDNRPVDHTLREELRVGDEPEKFELKDCETGEPVTLDGIGGNGTKAVPPVGFEDCVPPTVDSGYVSGVYWTVSTDVGKLGYPKTPILVNFAAQTRQKAVDAGLASIPFVPESLTNAIESSMDGTFGGGFNMCHQTGCDSVGFAISRRLCSANPNPICDLPPPIAVWPENDRNHLNYNTEKGCIEALCPDLNPHVSAKYKSCQDEMILCDKDGNKVHVKINVDGTMDVTQEKHGQTATIKDGKVASVKVLSETQLDRIFRD
ncbi:hypothetical protein ADP71_31890 [Vitreoscilla sp. C1]|uniref:hypothetical protein n=1 Tax=Vitreoscilla sp. (strain C1) TaxID=96942 RepID=UPI000CDC7C39|nr:hypothetical protein [Vitreoscilla sp. C1]AUZ06367.1 hypothetical protein ADP71_31890 [Vitreoscilla sp. C1]